MNKSCLIPVLASLLAPAAPALAADTPDGKQLVMDNCIRCHDDKLYTRPNRRVTTPEGLHKQVTNCERALGLKWFDDEIDAVVSYLNQNYYHFE
jgi:mono/diheme cytochrome c family protein